MKQTTGEFPPQLAVHCCSPACVPQKKDNFWSSTPTTSRRFALSALGPRHRASASGDKLCLTLFTKPSDVCKGRSHHCSALHHDLQKGTDQTAGGSTLVGAVHRPLTGAATMAALACNDRNSRFRAGGDTSSSANVPINTRTTFSGSSWLAWLKP